MRTWAILLLFSLSYSAIAADIKVIYGDDNREEADLFFDQLFRSHARSTAAMVDNKHLEENKDGEGFVMTEEVKSLKDSPLNLCQEEKFSDQPFLASCSGFLVAEDVLVTAGHCFSGFMETACESHSWVFDYKGQTGEEAFTQVFSEDNVYRCKEVIKVELDRATLSDYAIIKLDRKVKGRRPLPVRKSGDVKVGDELVVIGHPWGLPSKIADGAKVLFNENNTFFSASLDTFQGNSGSAVFNAKTGLVEGILVRGKTDAALAFRDDGVCRVVNRCDEEGKNCTAPDEGQKGEDVTKIVSFLSVLEPHL